MKPKLVATIALITIIALSAFYIVWQNQQATSATQNEDGLFQLAAFNTFCTGQYQGNMTYQDLEKHGDFGIGTFDGLAGEMVAYDGVFYQIPSSGIPREADPAQLAPYATITYFHTDQTFQVENLNYTSLQTFLTRSLPDTAIYAIKMQGTFSSVEARSPQKQAEPYPNITDALETQALFNLSDVSATAVGFRFPASMDGVDYAGYHMHIITDDHSAGGHILNCFIENATVEVDVIKQYNLTLP